MEKIIAREIKEEIPAVFVEYLWRLAQEPEAAVFSLVPSAVGGGPVQDIYYNGGRKRVFGFAPVKGTVYITKAGDRCEMRLTA